jgi:malate synthase
VVDVRVEGPPVERGEEVLTPAALEFVADLQTRFGAHRDALLAARAARRAEIAAARSIDVREETADVRSGDWQVPPPPGLVDRRVEITGPTDAPDGKDYRLREDGDLPTIGPRPRGWHLPERHLLVDEFRDFLTLPAYELVD